MRSFSLLSLIGSIAAGLVLIGLPGCGGGGGTEPSTPSTTDTESAKPASDSGTKEAEAETKAEESGGGGEAAAAEGWGTIKGRVVYDGDAPEPRVLVEQGAPEEKVRDAKVCAQHTIYSEELVVDKETKGIKWAVVWVNRPPKVHPDLEAVPSEPAELNQKGCIYIPHVLAIRQGQKLIIASEDPITHNTNIQGFRNNPWNRVLPEATEGKQTLEGPQLVAESVPLTVACNIHPWMKAYIAVFKHPYFAVTNDKGEFVIENVPAGKVNLVSWQESLGRGPGGRKGIEVEVKPGETVEVTITFSPK